jgi:hypothetical protein
MMDNDRNFCGLTTKLIQPILSWLLLSFPHSRELSPELSTFPAIWG